MDKKIRIRCKIQAWLLQKELWNRLCDIRHILPPLSSFHLVGPLSKKIVIAVEGSSGIKNDINSKTAFRYL